MKSLFFPEKRGVGTYTLIKAGLKIESISVKWLFSKQRIKLKSVWRTLCRLTCKQRERLHRQRFFQFSSCRERRTKNNSESLTSLELNMRKVDQFLMNSQSIYFTAVHILLSLMALFGNFLILVALHKVSSLHPPSKVLYRCLAATDLLVSIFNYPLESNSD